MVNVTIYMAYMDPMGICSESSRFSASNGSGGHREKQRQSLHGGPRADVTPGQSEDPQSACFNSHGMSWYVMVCHGHP